MQTKTDYENALALNSKDAEAHFTRALACEKAGKRSEATESFRGFLWSAPEGPGYGIYREYAFERIIELEKHFHDDVKGREY